MAKQYNMKIFTDKTKALAFEGNSVRRVKFVLSNQMIKHIHILTFNYLGYSLRSNKYNDISMKFCKF